MKKIKEAYTYTGASGIDIELYPFLNDRELSRRKIMSLHFEFKEDGHVKGKFMFPQTGPEDPVSLGQEYDFIWMEAANEEGKRAAAALYAVEITDVEDTGNQYYLYFFDADYYSPWTIKGTGERLEE